MARAGQVEVALSARQCAAAARWLATYRPPPPSLLGNPAYPQSARANAAILADRFAKSGRSQSRASAVRILPWALASWFGQQLDWCIVRGKYGMLLPPALVIQAMQVCRTKTSRKRGRPRLVGTKAELAAQQLADGNERHRRQLRRRAEYDRNFEDWVSRLTARGETLITSREPPPKI
ncbi:hypothetical protein [Novosphingobium sp.]|uniref:hypothetical protein n=1 Tax=Novosphingobium sp. TaxID=1874826 RepID=UPI0025FB7F3F|nr:hypothetical protein [Novosphingobium sp.]MCC6924419.1 hypothetical protein [Novosphingobium sp.]